MKELKETMAIDVNNTHEKEEVNIMKPITTLEKFTKLVRYNINSSESNRTFLGKGNWCGQSPHGQSWGKEFEELFRLFNTEKGMFEFSHSTSWDSYYRCKIDIDGTVYDALFNRGGSNRFVIYDYMDCNVSINSFHDILKVSVIDKTQGFHSISDDDCVLDMDVWLTPCNTNYGNSEIMRYGSNAEHVAYSSMYGIDDETKLVCLGWCLSDNVDDKFRPAALVSNQREVSLRIGVGNWDRFEFKGVCRDSGNRFVLPAKLLEGYVEGDVVMIDIIGKGGKKLKARLHISQNNKPNDSRGKLGKFEEVFAQVR